MRDHQRQRILLAALDVFAERGLAAATVKELIGRAHVSRATFYEVFDDKEACMAALHEEILNWLGEEVATAIAELSDWSAQVRLAVSRVVQLLAGDPRLAVVCVVEAPAHDATQIRAQHDRIVEKLCDGLRAGRAQRPSGKDLPEVLEPVLIYGAIYLIGRTIVFRQEPDAVTLGSELAELLLVPYSA